MFERFNDLSGYHSGYARRHMSSSSVRWIKSLSLVVICCTATSWLARSDARTRETLYVLKSLIFAVIDLLNAHPLALGLANGLVALLLLLTCAADAKHATTVRRVFSRLVAQLNRSASHLEGLFTWLTVAVWWAPSLSMQIAAVLAIAILGPLALDSVVRSRHSPTPTWRLLMPAAVTLVGLLLVVLSDVSQWRGLLPLVAVVLAGLVPRTAWSLWTARSLRASADQDSPWAQFVDRLLVAASLGTLVLIPLRVLKPGHRASLENRLHRTESWLSCTEARPEDPPPFSLFIVADNQFHALDGKRSGFEMDLVDTEVPVAVRPVELDLLSAVTLRFFADIYRGLKTTRRGLKTTRPSMQWAHLGDGADIGCVSEVERFLALAPRFGIDDLAAVIPGNHDGAFLGNLAWHPDWDDACPGGRSNPEWARQRLRTLMPSRPGRVVSDSSQFLAAVATLGTIGTEPVVGVFLDTTDTPWDRVGVAGVQGGISDEQEAWIEARLAREPQARVILFGHHPLDQWTPVARQKLELLAKVLGPRLWAVVSAHTHVAAMRPQQLAGRTVPEFIVGSTIDPPQEAALLEADWSGSKHELVLRMRTVPAVTRTGMTCAGERQPGVSAQTCELVFRKIHDSPRCAALFSQAAISSFEKNSQCGMDTPDDVKCGQQTRAENLLSCLGVSIPNHDPLRDPNLPTRILSVGEQDSTAMVCLSWAASVLQAHKRDHWTFARAIDFSLDPSAIWGEFEASWPAEEKNPERSP